MARKNRSESQRILIYRLGSLGDTVIALPCFHLIRRAFPEARITLLTNVPVAAKAAPLEMVLGAGYFFDEVLSYPLGARDPKILWKLIQEIRGRRIDTLIFLLAARGRKATLRDRIFFRLAGIRRFFGFPSVAADFQPTRIPGTNQYQWEAQRLVNRLSEVGDVDLEDDSLWDLRLLREERERAEQLISGDEPTLAVSLGTKVQAKDWGENNWTDLLRLLSKKLPGWRLVLLGATDERERSERCGAVWAGTVVNLCGETLPRVSAAVLQRAKLFIGHDSGPMHLAAAVGIPVVAIFAARNLPGQWYPRGKKNVVLYHQVECFGCGLDTCIEERKRCILGISVEEVCGAVLGSLPQSQSLPISLES